MSPSKIQVIILCGGLGTRLGTLTANTPKPMMPILGEPFLKYQVDMLFDFGFRKFLFLTGYFGEQIEEYFRIYGKSKGFVSEFSRETEPLGTGGALKLARPKIDEIFLLLNGDSYLTMDYPGNLDRFLGEDFICSISAYKSPETSGSIEGNNLALDGNVVLLYQKKGNDPRLSHVDSGVLYSKISLLDRIKDSDGKRFSLEEDVWPRVIIEKKMSAFEVNNPPYDIGTPERMARFEEFLKSREI